MKCLKLKVVERNGERHSVPCGACAFCLVNKRSEWMFRIHHEMRTQIHRGWFLTLTYDERFVRRVPEVGLSLRFRDTQLYLKKLRKRKRYVKYICVGEYGGLTARPHYHLLIWTDATEEELQACWSNSQGVPFGRVHFGRLTMQSAMYTLKYIIQPKQKTTERLEKTRAQFSKGLGLSYLSSAVYDYHTEDYDNPVLFSIIDERKVALPRYYKQKIFTKYQLREEALKTRFDAHIHMIKERKPLLLKLGFKGAKNYLQSLRVEQAARIIKKTKYNQNL